MPQPKLKPSEVAAEAKKKYFPYISHIMPQYPLRTYPHPDSRLIRVAKERRTRQRTRVAIIDGDPVDVAIDWYETLIKDDPNGTALQSIPIINMANEKRPGGDWESGLIAPEECLARRSTLMAALLSSWNLSNSVQPYHPLPPTGGLYSPHIVVFRDGPENYDVWNAMKTIPVISVAPVRRPKINGGRYSFDEEKELMMNRMRTALRIAAAWSHRNICLGAFGVGPIFKNPVREVARMWRFLLFHEDEFRGVFSNVVFAIDGQQGGNNKACQFDIDVFREEFDPATVFRTSYR